MVSLGRFAGVASSLDAKSMPLVFVACAMATPAFVPPFTHCCTSATPAAFRLIVAVPTGPVTVPTIAARSAAPIAPAVAQGALVAALFQVTCDSFHWRRSSYTSYVLFDSLMLRSVMLAD